MAEKIRVASGNHPIRQGDVLLIPTTEESGEPAPADKRGLVLAEGERSGHWHAVIGSGHKLFQRAGTERMLQVVGRGATLKVIGDESRHAPITVPPGRWLVRVQRAWTSENASRQVID